MTTRFSSILVVTGIEEVKTATKFYSITNLRAPFTTLIVPKVVLVVRSKGLYQLSEFYLAANGIIAIVFTVLKIKTDGAFCTPSPPPLPRPPVQGTL